jgi:hypothetical protein
MVSNAVEAMESVPERPAVFQGQINGERNHDDPQP